MGSPTYKRSEYSTVAPLYANCGRYLIGEYPREFTAYFLAPNALKYYTPPVEFLSSYNAGDNSVAPIAEVWFGYNARTVRTAFKDMKVTFLDFFSIASCIFNVLFILGIISFVMLEGIQKMPQLSKALLVVTGLWLGNFLFRVFAASIALRFQLFPILVAFAFDLMLLQVIIKSAIDKESTVLHS